MTAATTIPERRTVAAVRPTAAATPTPGRDASIDVARAWCLVVVVGLHAMMVGVSVGPSGVVLENALDGRPGFSVATWFVQVMPLFFLLGGASGYLHRRRRVAAGERAAVHAAARVARLLPPALAAAVCVVVVLAVLAWSGVPRDVVAEAGFRMSQPLWFLGVNVLCGALLPAAVAAHDRHRWCTVALLAAAVVAVEAVRAVTGVEAIGFASLLLVWPLLQQLGFLLVDGTLAGVPRPLLGLGAIGALGAALALCAVGGAPFDLFAALNPPGPVLVVVGVAQLVAFEAVRPSLRRLHDRPVVARVTTAINARAMSVYSWHMLVLVGAAGVVLAVGGDAAPVPGTAAWWATRPVWLLTTGIGVALLVALAGGIETRRASGSVRSGAVAMRAAAGVALAAGGALVVLAGGGGIAAWTVGAIAWSLALVAVRAPGSGPRARADSGRGRRQLAHPGGDRRQAEVEHLGDALDAEPRLVEGHDLGVQALPFGLREVVADRLQR